MSDETIRIRVTGMDPNDWAPPHLPEQPARALTADEVETVQTAIANLKDVGWRPFFDEGKAWQAALDWSLSIINEALAVTECVACGHDTPHGSPGYDGCVADVMYEDVPSIPPYFLQCCCDGTSGPVKS